MKHREKDLEHRENFFCVLRPAKSLVRNGIFMHRTVYLCKKEEKESGEKTEKRPT